MLGPPRPADCVLESRQRRDEEEVRRMVDLTCGRHMSGVRSEIFGL